MEIELEFEKLFTNKLSFQEGKDFLISLYKKGESAEDILIASKIMRKYSNKIELPKNLQKKAIDIVGTGGDKSNSFNISSTVSLLLASTGSTIIKHGNRSVTSQSGSADVLEELGIKLNVSNENQIKMAEEVNFCFMFAKNYHPSMKYIKPIRDDISHRTIFNILGPLTNPAKVEKYFLGVFSSDYIKRISKVLMELNVKRAFILSSEDGMDEISISGKTKFINLENKNISEGEINPQDYGFKLSNKESIKGGKASVNAKIIEDIFSGKEKGAKRDIILLNSAFAIKTDKEEIRDIQEALEIAKDTLDSGKAKRHLKKILEISNKM